MGIQRTGACALVRDRFGQQAGHGCMLRAVPVLRVVPVMLLWAACAPGSANAPVCEAPERVGTLPSELAESSGVTASRRHPGILWTHNDSGGGAVLFAIDSTGKAVGQVRITDAENVDWEDIALGPCPAGDCLYIGDIGDNAEGRDSALIYRVPEPHPDAASAAAEPFPIRYAGGARDAEALFVLPSGDVFIVSKGRSEPVTVYRYPAPLRAGERVTLQPVQQLTDAAVPVPAQVTGAGAAPNGRWVGVRSYMAVQLYRAAEEHVVAILDGPDASVLTLGEPVGEAVAVRADDTIVLTSEAGSAGSGGPVSRVRCTLP